MSSLGRIPGLGGVGGGGRRRKGKHRKVAFATCLWVHMPHPSWPPWCLLTIIKVEPDLRSLSLFQVDQGPAACLEHQSMTATVFSSSRICLSRLPKDAAAQPPLRGPRAQDPPLATADWIRDGHLTQLDQSDALPGPWDTLTVLGSFCWLLERLVPGTV